MGTLGGVVDVTLFSAIEFFGGFDAEVLAEFVAAAYETSYQRGDVIFREEDDATDLFIVRSGRIAIANRSIDGRESVLALMGPGDLFGEMALFDGAGRSAGARALEESILVSLPFTLLRDQFAKNSASLWNVVTLLVRRLRVADEALADSVFLDVTGRTAKRLLDIAGSADAFTLPVTQEELAGMIGASRERVNKAIAAFIRLGWIEQSDRTYRILDRRKMTLRAC